MTKGKVVMTASGVKNEIQEETFPPVWPPTIEKGDIHIGVVLMCGKCFRVGSKEFSPGTSIDQIIFSFSKDGWGGTSLNGNRTILCPVCYWKEVRERGKQ